VRTGVPEVTTLKMLLNITLVGSAVGYYTVQNEAKWSRLTYPSDGARLGSWADTLLPVFQGLERRKNKFPVGEVIVMLFVPLAVLIKYPLIIQPTDATRLLFCCNV
jgi:hypothetical protein